MGGSLCDHIMDALNEMNVLDVCRNVLSASFDAVVNVFLLLRHLRKPLPYSVADGIADLGGKRIYRTGSECLVGGRNGLRSSAGRLQPRIGGLPLRHDEFARESRRRSGRRVRLLLCPFAVWQRPARIPCGFPLRDPLAPT